MLSIPTGGGGFVIYSDASKNGLSCVLMQNEKLIAYASRRLKNYDCTINYHPGKANSVADALSRKSYGELYRILAIRKPILLDLQRLGIEIEPYGIIERLSVMTLKPSLLEQIKEG